MGPCKITPKATRGVCGADADLIVSRNILRSLAAGVAQHGAHARELMLLLKAVAEGNLDLPILDPEKLKATAVQFGIEVEGREINHIALDLANVLLEDLSRAVPDEYKTIKACAPPGRQKFGKS